MTDDRQSYNGNIPGGDYRYLKSWSRSCEHLKGKRVISVFAVHMFAYLPLKDMLLLLGL